MNPDTAPSRRSLLRDVLLLQVKLVLDAVRDVALSPLTLAAAALDFLLAGRQPPRYFLAVLRLGERSDEWIDLWAATRGTRSTDRENVDAMLARIEEVISDPKTGARRARVLKRWAERQVSRARQHGEGRALAQGPVDPDRTST